MSTAENLRKLQELAEQYPERLEAVKKAHPEWWQILVDAKREIELLELCKSDSPEGYCAFYEGIHGIKPPWQVALWIKEIYEAHEQGLGYTLNGFRGSWKSVSVSVDFTTWRIGKEPRKTNMVISANDDSADKITKAIAQIIEFHPFWKKAFPNIVPDEGRWSGNGYWVVDNSMPKEEWANLQAGVIDPTLLGGGYTSTRINGKHPTGVLAIDDIHDLNNSTSDTERRYVVRFVTTILMKAVIRINDKLDTWIVNVGVPWAEDDTHRVLSRSGAFKSHNLAVMKAAREGDEGAVYIDGVNDQTGVVYEDIKGWWILTWGDKFGINTIKKERGLGKFDFGQMMMMDLSSAKAGGIRYYTYPKRDVDRMWPCVSGVDPSYTFKERKEFERKSSAFALGNVLKRPQGGAVLEGGILEQCSTNTAANHLAATKSIFQNHQYFAVENVGIGRLFLETMRLINPSLIIVGSDLGGIRMKGERAGKAKDKSTRIRTELAPHLENATIFISDEDTEYLNAVRDGLDNFGELDPTKADFRWDALDAFYHAVKAMPDVLQKAGGKEEIVFKKVSHSPLEGRQAARYGYRRD